MDRQSTERRRRDWFRDGRSPTTGQVYQLRHNSNDCMASRQCRSAGLQRLRIVLSPTSGRLSIDTKMSNFDVFVRTLGDLQTNRPVSMRKDTIQTRFRRRKGTPNSMGTPLANDCVDAQQVSDAASPQLHFAENGIDGDACSNNSGGPTALQFGSHFNGNARMEYLSAGSQ